MSLKETQVFTPSWATNQMLDLIGDEKLLDESTFLFEPSCGNGEMLLAMLERIFDGLKLRYDGDSLKAACEALHKFKAIELDVSLVKECRMRVFQFFMDRIGDQSLPVQYLVARQVQDAVSHADFFEFMKRPALSKGRNWPTPGKEK